MSSCPAVRTAGQERAWASGFLVKDAEPAGLIQAVRVVAQLNARDRAQLVAMAYESGLVVPGQRAA